MKTIWLISHISCLPLLLSLSLSCIPLFACNFFASASCPSLSFHHSPSTSTTLSTSLYLSISILPHFLSLSLLLSLLRVFPSNPRLSDTLFFFSIPLFAFSFSLSPQSSIPFISRQRHSLSLTPYTPLLCSLNIPCDRCLTTM